MKTNNLIQSILALSFLCLHAGEPASQTWTQVDQPIFIPAGKAPKLGAGMNGPFNGQLRDLRIHTRTLTAEEIQAMSAMKPAQ